MVRAYIFIILYIRGKTKISQSVNILNESGIILEFSFKDIIEKIKDFFNMIGRKIKELWNKIFHRNQNLDNKINEANAVYDAWEDIKFEDFEGVEETNLPILFAFELFIDFINLFMDLLRLFGDAKD